MTRQEIAVAIGVNPGTITNWEKKGLQAARRGKRGEASLFDLDEVKAWRRQSDEADSSKPERLNLEYERARLARAQAEKTERENLVRAGQLVEAAAVIREGQNYTKAWASKVRAFPRRLVQAGYVTRENEAAVAAVCHELLLEIASWKSMADTDEKKRAKKKKPKTRPRRRPTPPPTPAQAEVRI